MKLTSIDLQARNYSSLVAICFGIGYRRLESVIGGGWVKWFLSKTNLFVWMDDWMDDWTDDGLSGIKGCFISHPQKF
jgi:hypothetical protein